MTWRDIETAPWDKVIQIAYRDRSGRMTFSTGLHWSGDEWACDSDEFLVVPTHWMPLPNPPEKLRESADSAIK